LISDEELERGRGGEGGGGVSNSRRQITNEEAKSTKMLVDDQIATCTTVLALKSAMYWRQYMSI
jgi:hypothetical protein